MNDYDQAAPYAVRHLHYLGFFRWLMGERFYKAWRYLRWLDTQAVPFPGEQDRRYDTAAAFEQVAQDHPPLALVVEFMSRTRRPTLTRVAQYCLQIQTDCPYQVEPRVEFACIGAIVNLTGGEQADTFDGTPPDAGGLGLKGKFKVCTLANKNARRVLNQIRKGDVARSILVWLPLMKGADTVRFVQDWRRQVLLETNAGVQGDIIDLAFVFAELAGREPLWRQELGDLRMERSEIMQTWEKTGEQRGEQRGQLLATRANLVSYLETHYKIKLPAEVRAAIESEADLARLTDWFNTAIGSSLTFKQLRKKLGWPTSS